MTTMNTRPMTRWAAAWTVAQLACGCGGSSGAVAPNGPSTGVDLTGTWSATWTSRSGAVGQGTMVLTQSGASVTGAITVQGSPCVVNADVTGSLDGDALAATFTFGGGEATLDATVSATATQLSGTYDAASAGACTGDTGTIIATR